MIEDGRAPGDLADLAERIVAARSQHRLLPAPVDHGLSPRDAYDIQARVLAPRMRTGGGRGGWKLGYTSAVMREQMGVEEPNFGPLSRAMILDASGPDAAVVSAGVTQPKAEPEIAAVLAVDVPTGATVEELRSCVRSWRLAIEVVDSVWEGYRFDWALNTADGSSAAFVALGPPLLPPHAAGEHSAVVDDVDLSTIEVVLSRNGRPEAQGRSDAAMGDPVQALHWLVRQLEKSGDGLRAGDVVITGGLARAVDLSIGDVISVTAQVGRSGEVVTAEVTRR